MTSELLKNYDKVEKDIRQLYDSRLRLSILDALKDGPMPLSDLRRAVDANAPNTSAKAKDLEEMGLLERVGGQYKLTPYGLHTLNGLSDSLAFHSTYNKFKDFWSTRRLDSIPKELWRRLGDLRDATLLKTDNTNVSAVHDRFVEFLNSLEGRFYGLSPIYHDEYVSALFNNLRKGLDTKLVLTSDILGELVGKLKTMDLSPEILGTLQKAEIYEYANPMTIALTVSVDETFIGFQKKDRSWIADFGLYAEDAKSVRWAYDLFEYHRSRSKKINLSDYL